MRDENFEWDDNKAESNFRKHGITFEMARAAFDDPDSIDREDPDPDEGRVSRICRYGPKILVIVWTERSDRVRIISARLASTHEQRDYIRQ